MRIYFMLFAIWALLDQVQLSAQTFRAQPVNYRDLHLSESFKTYAVYELPVKEISQYIHQQSFAVPLKIMIGSEVFEWTLYENNILDPNAKGMTLKDGKYIPLDFDRKCRTYIGYSSDTYEEARFTITDNNFTAMIPMHGLKTFIQPVHHLNRNANERLVVQYTQSDLPALPQGICNAPQKKKTLDFTDPHKSPKSSAHENNGTRTFSCIELQVSFATDNQMWQQYEDVDLLLDFNLTVLNLVEPFFDDFDIDFIVDDFFMVTEPENDANPWGMETDVDDLLDDFGDWAESYFSSQDFGHLWSNHDLHDGDNFDIAGLAYVGGTCGDIGIYQWAILERFSASNFYALALLQAHEYGHLLDADHEPGTGTIMEPSLGDIEAPTWYIDNIVEMNDFIEDEDCIENCVHCPLFLTVIDYISWGDWKYSTVFELNSTARIDSLADVIFQSEGYVKLSPGFSASSLQPASANGTFVARIANCE